MVEQNLGSLELRLVDKLELKRLENDLKQHKCIDLNRLTAVTKSTYLLKTKGRLFLGNVLYDEKSGFYFKAEDYPVESKLDSSLEIYKILDKSK